MSVPSEWVEQARVSSPDGKLEAVIVHANSTEALQTQGAEGRPSKRVPVGEQQYSPSNRVLCVRLVPKGEKVERERPFPLPTNLFLDRVGERSVFVSYYAPDLEVRWVDDGTLLIQGKVAKVVYQAEETERPRRVVVKYEITTPQP